jgi:hypothetical protein|tara:strand:+ start:116 stop:637 length:522 start_codon:yes stop_codon:yes gene_type:complete
MANTTFDGPVRSKNGFINLGPGMTKSLTADTTLSVQEHAGRILLLNDADGKFTLPSIVTTADSAVAGPGSDPNNLNNIGASFYFYIETLATDLDIKTDGTDKFTGAVIIAVNDGSKKAFVPGATNDVITMTGTTKGGIVGSVLQITAIDTANYLVHNSLLIGSGSIETPFADA